MLSAGEIKLVKVSVPDTTPGAAAGATKEKKFYPACDAVYAGAGVEYTDSGTTYRAAQEGDPNFENAAACYAVAKTCVGQVIAGISATECKDKDKVSQGLAKLASDYINKPGMNAATLEVARKTFANASTFLDTILAIFNPASVEPAPVVPPVVPPPPAEKSELEKKCASIGTAVPGQAKCEAAARHINIFLTTNPGTATEQAGVLEGERAANAYTPQAAGDLTSDEFNQAIAFFKSLQKPVPVVISKSRTVWSLYGSLGGAIPASTPTVETDSRSETANAANNGGSTGNTASDIYQCQRGQIVDKNYCAQLLGKEQTPPAEGNNPPVVGRSDSSLGFPTSEYNSGDTGLVYRFGARLSHDFDENFGLGGNIGLVRWGTTYTPNDSKNTPYAAPKVDQITYALELGAQLRLLQTIELGGGVQIGGSYSEIDSKAGSGEKLQTVWGPIGAKDKWDASVFNPFISLGIPIDFKTDDNGGFVFELVPELQYVIPYSLDGTSTLKQNNPLIQGASQLVDIEGGNTVLLFLTGRFGGAL